MLHDIEHIVVDCDRNRYAGHPRQGGIFQFGPSEIAVLYNRAPCRYQEPADCAHDLGGYHSRSQQILTRSLDGGRTWKHADDVVVFDETRPIEERRAFVGQVDANPAIARERIDLNSPDAAVFTKSVGSIANSSQK